MKFHDIFLYVWRSISTTSMRSYLTILGIVIGVLAVVVITSISDGVQRDINNQLSAFGSDKLFVSPAVSGSRTFAPGPLQSATSGKLFERDVESISSIAGVKSTAKSVYGRLPFGFRDKEVTATIYGMESSFFEQWKDYLVIESGRTYKSGERGIVVLGNDAAKKTFGKDEIDIGNNLVINGNTYKVIGIFKKIGTSLSAADDSSIYIPFEDGKQEFGSQLSKNEVQMISIQLVDGYPTQEVQNQIEYKLASNHKVKLENKDFMVISSDYINQTIGSLLSVLSLFLLFITMIATFVGGIGIMNTMFMGIMERVHEIGVLKAIGATESDILSIFLSESALLGFIGGALGLAIGILLLVIAGYFGVPVWLRVHTIAFSFVFSTVIGILAGIIPARQAARLDPVEALRYE